MKLKDFSFKQVCSILKDLNIKNIDEQIKIYGLFGGSIYYYKLIEKYECENFEDIIKNYS